MNRRSLIAVVAVAAAVAALALARRPPALAQVGRAAPDFELAGLAGQAVSLRQFRGKLVLVNFWASWCPDCREEFPTLEAAYKRHRGDGFEIVAPSVDENGRKAVMPFVAKAEPTFTILLADPQTADAYGVHALPSSFLIAPDGTILKRYIGGIEPRDLENDIVKELPRRNS